MTIIQVTHSEENAQYGNRIIKVVDGAIESDEIITKEQEA
jgi:ABC-type lipoprotein export system ATPase subunit